MATVNEWEHHLQEIMTEVRGPGDWAARGWSAADDPETQGVDCQLSTCETQLRLVLVTPGLFQPFAIAASQAALARDAPLWLHAIHEAGRRLGTNREIPWIAVVGPHDDSLGSPRALDGPAVIGRLRLTPGTPQPTERGGDPWWPIIVEGQTRSYVFDAAQVHAGRDVRQLTALLTLITPGYGFALRWGPLESDAGSGVAPRREPAPPDIQRIEIPVWLDGAWQRLDHDPRLRDAVLIHAEGVELWKRHPSLALVAFIAAIEGIGARYVSLKERCETCRNRIGAWRRFKHAVWLGTSDPARAKSYEGIYENFRSTTAHVGKLHGGEGTSGQVAMPSLLAAISGLGVGFTLGQVLDCMMLSATLVLQGVQGELPDATTDC